MRPREILARNLRDLMASRGGLDTLKKLVAASDGRLSNGKLDRVRRGIAATDVDTLEELAYTFGVEPWQLLYPKCFAADSEDEPVTSKDRRAAAAGKLPDMPTNRSDKRGTA